MDLGILLTFNNTFLGWGISVCLWFQHQSFEPSSLDNVGSPCLKNKQTNPGHSGTLGRQSQVHFCEIVVSLIYLASSRPAEVTGRTCL